MDLNPYLNGVREDLARATALADTDTRDVAERLIAALEPALRLRIIEALSDAAASVSSKLDGDLVEVRMAGAEPVWHVQRRAVPESAEPTVVVAEPDDAGTARITLRLPEGVKARADAAAEASGQSLNAWLVAAVRTTLTRTPTNQPGARSGHRITGWA
ncbi:MAG: toxin-antitoxin system HicB family antitoxin [Propionibacteriaceae bacterium]|nr:toxin-antitoxin system HicB family antitoxin [Propionibacteriaceae bacterium]